MLLALAAVAVALVGVRYFVPQSVPMYSVERGDFIVTLRAAGTLNAARSAAVASRVQGRLTELAVTANDIVDEGDVLARIQSDDLQSALTGATASWEAAQLATRQTEADLQRAQIARDDAQQTLERQRQLLERDTISQSAYDAASSTLQTAEANLAAAAAAVDRAQALELSAQAAADSARLTLGETVIVAPFDGVVIDTVFNIGDVISPGQSIVELADPATLVLTARLDESVISRVQVGDTATIFFGGNEELPIGATVVALGRKVDTETREFTVDIKPTALPENWAIGQRGRAVIQTSRLPDVLSIPTDLIETRGDRKGVWVVENGRANWRAVTLGDVGGDRVSIFDGLASGDAVIDPRAAYPWMLVAEGTVQP